MAIDIHAVLFLLRARTRGVSFGNVLTIGRQTLDVAPKKLCILLQRYNLPHDSFRNETKLSGYADEFFQCLGATHVQSLDVSNYEGATLVHDLNRPVKVDWQGQYDVVYDGGALEHVFNLPVALRNCMEMVKVGGSLFLDSPGNNWFGHGFYQFSPELFYSALSQENGYEVVDMIAHAAGPQARWYRVANPRVLRTRVELISFSLIHLLTHARRNTAEAIFAATPQQSDYAASWQTKTSALRSPHANSPALTSFAQCHMPTFAAVLKALKTGWSFYRSHSLRNRQLFTPIPKR